MQADAHKVGDRFWFQPYDRRYHISPQVAAVTAVGRKWLTLEQIKQTMTDTTTPAPTDAALWDAWRTAVDTTDPTQGNAA